MWVNATSKTLIEWAGSKGYSLLISTLETDEEVHKKVALYDSALSQAGRDRNEVQVVLKARSITSPSSGRLTTKVRCPSDVMWLLLAAV